MIKLKPSLVVLAVLLLFSLYFCLGMLFPTVMFLLSMGLAFIALCISVYKIADKHFSQFESEEEIENK